MLLHLIKKDFLLIKKYLLVLAIFPFVHLSCNDTSIPPNTSNPVFGAYCFCVIGNFYCVYVLSICFDGRNEIP